MSDKIIIEVEEDIKELIPTYLKNMKNNVKFFRNMLEKDDFGHIRERGHNIKGSGGGYGFDRISEIGREIEMAAREENKEAIIKEVDSLDDFLDRLEVVYI